MLFLIRNGLAIIRWLIHAGMLMLIMLLLFMDTPERRPFVQSLVLGVVAEVQSNWDRDGMPVDPGADPAAEPSRSEAEEGEPWNSSEPSPGNRRDDGSEFPQMQRNGDLPADFVAELEKAVARSRDRQARDDWTEFAAAQGRAAQVESAVRLALHLPQQWWTVDGELINELDLAAVLCHRTPR